MPGADDKQGTVNDQHTGAGDGQRGPAGEGGAGGDGGVSRGEFDKLTGIIADLGGKMNTLVETLSKPAPVHPEAPRPPEPPKRTDRTRIVELIRTGTAEEAAAALETLEREMTAQTRFEIAPSLEHALRASEPAAVVAAKSKFKMPYYDEYADEIKIALDNMGPRVRTSADGVHAAYRYVIGGHLEEIQDKEKERILRGDEGDEGDHGRSQGGPRRASVTPLPGARTGRGRSEQSAAPSPRELLSKQAFDLMVQQTGDRTGESYAKRRGFNSWTEYATKFGLWNASEDEGSSAAGGR